MLIVGLQHGRHDNTHDDTKNKDICHDYTKLNAQTVLLNLSHFDERHFIECHLAYCRYDVCQCAVSVIKMIDIMLRVIWLIVTKQSCIILYVIMLSVNILSGFILSIILLTVKMNGILRVTMLSVIFF
jgi:hypothetical protein